MNHDPLRCEVCNAIQWSKAPRMANAYLLFTEYAQLTSRIVADNLGISISSASNVLHALHRIGAIILYQRIAISTGGIEDVYVVAKTPINMPMKNRKCP